MGRYPQREGTRGSLRWLQALLGIAEPLLTDALRAADGRPVDWNVTWLSPRRADDWAEYRDQAFLSLLGLDHLASDLEEFWPQRGPQWDALGQTTSGGVVLLEAKAHEGELTSVCAASLRSKLHIEESLQWAKQWLGARGNADWLSGYYQCANRLAHLAFLRDRGVDATLAFVYFCGDSDMNGPGTSGEWKAVLRQQYAHLGLADDLSTKHVVNVYLPVEVIGALVD